MRHPYPPRMSADIVWKIFNMKIVCSWEDRVVRQVVAGDDDCPCGGDGAATGDVRDTN